MVLDWIFFYQSISLRQGGGETKDSRIERDDINAMCSGKWVQEMSCNWSIFVGKNVGFGKRVWRCTRGAS